MASLGHSELSVTRSSSGQSMYRTCLHTVLRGISTLQSIQKHTECTEFTMHIALSQDANKQSKALSNYIR